MNIAVISDTHDNIWTLDQAMPHLRGSDLVIHCGDLCSPFVIQRLGEGLGDVPVHIVWGNNDGDTFLGTQVAGEFANVHLHGPLMDVEVAGWRIAANHYPEIARGLALSGQYDLVCYGHDHKANEERMGGCLLLNPGEVMGLYDHRSMALVDLEKGEVDWVDLN